MGKTADIIHEQCARLRIAAIDLRSLGSAFGRIGLADSARELGDLSILLTEVADAIPSAYNEERMAHTNQSLANSQKFMGTVLAALVAGKDPKDACLEAFPAHFDRSIVDAQAGEEPEA